MKREMEREGDGRKVMTSNCVINAWISMQRRLDSSLNETNDSSSLCHFYKELQKDSKKLSLNAWWKKVITEKMLKQAATREIKWALYGLKYE